MKYINQKDYPEKSYVTRTRQDEEKRQRGLKCTVAKSGCGLCSAIMVADRLLIDPQFGLDEAIQLSYDSGANGWGGTNYKIYSAAFAEKMGFQLETSNDPEDLRRCLRTGGAAVVHIGGDREGHVGVFSHGGHYVAAISELADGRIAILDPSYLPGKFDEPGREGLVEMKGKIAYTSAEVLVEDTANRDPGFYLFWRK